MDIISRIRNYLKSHSLRRIWYRVALILSSMAVFVTTYFLMLPALTVEIYGTDAIKGNIVNDVIKANNVYPIDAILGPEAGYKGANKLGAYTAHTKTILTNAKVNVVLLKINTSQNLRSYFYGVDNGDASKDGSTAFGIKLEDFIAYRIRYSTTYKKYYVFQYYSNVSSVRLMGSGSVSDKEFLLLVKKTYIQNGNNNYPMYVPDKADGTEDGKLVNDSYTYTAQKDIYVHVNTAAFAKYEGNTTADFLAVEGCRPSYEDAAAGKFNYDFGYVTLSPYVNQNSVSNAVAMSSDVSEDKLAKNVTFKMFDYTQQSINKKRNGWSLFNDSKTINDCFMLAPYFSFKNVGHLSEVFYNYWGNYAACVCASNATQQTCTGVKKSLLHKNDTYDADGFTVNHAVTEYNLGANGYPVLDLSRNAKFNLRSNYPSISAADRNLGYLFDQSIADQYIDSKILGQDAVKQYNATNTILQYDPDNCKYWYDSAQNAVDFNTSTKKFYVRGYTERNDDSAQVGVDMTNYRDFLPFNYGKGIVTETYSNYSFTNVLRDSTFNRFDFETNTTEWDNVNYWFGMTMEFNFIQGKDGKVTYVDSSGKTKSDVMKFTFSGDDDVWVFIDGVKVLDLGGTHGQVTGTIDFSTGNIQQYLSWNGGTASSTTTSFPTTLRDCFSRANKTNSVEWNAANTSFADYSMHNLKFFYLERGSAVANCSIQFNLQTFNDKALVVGKELHNNPEETNPDENVLEFLRKKEEYLFRVVKEDKSTLLITEGMTYRILEEDVEVGTGIVGTNGIFKLKHGQKAIFDNMWSLTNGETLGEVNYYVQEIVPSNQMDQYYPDAKYSINSLAPAEATRKVEGETYVHTSGELTNAETQTVIFSNYLDNADLRELYISKKVQKFPSGEGSGSYNMQVKLDDVLLPVGTVYYIAGSTDTRTVAEAGIVTVNAGETIIIKGILDGTTYEVQETAGSISAGYVVYYNGELTTNVSGEIDTNNVNIEVVNSQVGTNIIIDVYKELVNAVGSSEFSFDFTLKKVESNTHNSPLVDSNTLSETIVVSGDVSSGIAKKEFIIQYLASDMSVDTVEYYYRIDESIEDENKLSIITYDDSYYIVTVRVSKNSVSSLSADIIGVTKYASNGTSTEIDITNGLNDSLKFVNILNLYNLPSTGGKGKDIMVIPLISGLLMVLGASFVILFILKKRRGLKNKIY